MNRVFAAEKPMNFRWTKYSPRCRIGVNCCTRNEKTIICRRRWEHILNTTDLGVAVVIFRFSKEKKFFSRNSLRILKKKIFFFFIIHGNELRFKNNHQNTLKPEYVVNELLKRIWVTFDNFSKNFRVADDFFRKFWKKVIPILKIFQKVIKNEPEVLLISINIIFRFQIILMVIAV